MVSRYEVKDPLWSRIKSVVALVAVCSWRGHARPPAFGGGVKPCLRCDR